jgi:hypothetical protein
VRDASPLEHGERFLPARLLALVEHGPDAGQELPVLLLAATLEPVVDGSPADTSALRSVLHGRAAAHSLDGRVVQMNERVRSRVTRVL